MNKKKIIIGLCLASCIGLVGCGNSQDAVMSNLTTQIDFLNNTVNSINRNVESLPNISIENNIDKSLTKVYQSAKDTYNNHRSYKTAITTKNAMIKKAISNNDLKLTEQDKKALIDLTTALSKNTKSLDESRSELVRASTDVNRNYKDRNSTTTQISAKINRLSNCMNSQSSYYKNLINTLNNIEEILNINDDSFDYSNISNNPCDSCENNSKNMQDLFYQYMLNDLNNQNNSEDKNITTYPLNNDCQNGNCNKPAVIPEVNNINNGNNCQNGFCPSANNNLINNQNGFYGANYNQVTNPSRNTDTYRPLNRNIDTYRPFYPGYNYPQNNEIIAQTVDTHPTPVGDETDIRRNNNTNQVENSNHHRKHPIRNNPRINQVNANDLKTKDYIEKVKEIDFQKDNKIAETYDDKVSLNEKENITNENKKVSKDTKDIKDKKQDFAGKTEHLSENKTGLILDVNKKIKDLITRKDQETFNNSNYLKLR